MKLAWDVIIDPMKDNRLEKDADITELILAVIGEPQSQSHRTA